MSKCFIWVVKWMWWSHDLVPLDLPLYASTVRTPPINPL